MAIERVENLETQLAQLKETIVDLRSHIASYEQPRIKN